MNKYYWRIVTLKLDPFDGEVLDEAGFMKLSPVYNRVWIGTLIWHIHRSTSILICSTNEGATALGALIKNKCSINPKSLCNDKPTWSHPTITPDVADRCTRIRDLLFLGLLPWNIKNGCRAIVRNARIADSHAPTMDKLE